MWVSLVAKDIVLAANAGPTIQTLPSETPTHFTLVTVSYDHERRDVMIPMRDGVKLHTVILIPKNAKRAPILLTRTPYNATELTSHTASSHLGPLLKGYDNAVYATLEGGYIRVVQDIRGKYGSEGDYVMNRPLRGRLNPTAVDEATDTYDTIDWLVKHIPESNGKVGTLGICYDGFEVLMSMVNPHPALKVAVPMNPMVDEWMGDDWFHHGAFRQQNLPYIHDQAGTRDNSIKWWSDYHDDYDLYMSAGSAGELGRRHGLEQIGFWNKLTEHPNYDVFWQEQAVDRLLLRYPQTVATMLVHSLWDQEDIYGAMAVYRALSPQDTQHQLYLVLGPWHHGQEIEEGSQLGALHFDSNTSKTFERDVLRPFLDHYLQDATPPLTLAPVTAFETGTNRWQQLPHWPAGCVTGCDPTVTKLYLHSAFGLSFRAAEPGNSEEFDEYISDPRKPVPYRVRPSQPVGYDNGLTWPQWLVDDQREFSGRTDVLTYTSDRLSTPLKIAGAPMVNLIAATSGSDSDWVVKLIDVYPDEVADQPAMGGYQLMVSADIFRGRYRESFSHPKPIAANQPLQYRFDLPNANHVFLPGHRIMVQIQSSWFPLYDRNPQTFVDNIFWAKPQDYRKATQRIYHSDRLSSFIELPIVSQ